MLSFQQFQDAIFSMPVTIPSKTGKASYADFNLADETLSFIRVNTDVLWELNIKELYSLYSTNEFINTTVVKGKMKKRVSSPSVAILMAINCIDHLGNRIQ
jgi:hypothetical protein